MVFLLLLPLVLPAPSPGQATRLAETYAGAIEKLNEAHLAKPKDPDEDALAERLPKKARKALEKLLKAEPDAEGKVALAAAADASLGLDLVEDFDRLRGALASVDPEAAAQLGVALSRERFLLLGENGLDLAYLEHFAVILDDILGAYDRVFGFEEWSKVPGKKLRVRVHLEPRITRPPHFAPQFRFHSEIDFPVIDAERLDSPTAKGQFLFYGLCHELGHVIAAWGNPSSEEDHHAWAHYTGVTIVEHLAGGPEPPAWLAHCRDVRWRSLSKERGELAGVAPGAGDRPGVLALFLGLHDLVGPGALGAALNHLDARDRALRVNRVRYYTLDQLAGALEKTLGDKDLRKRAAALFP